MKISVVLLFALTVVAVAKADGAETFKVMNSAYNPTSWGYNHLPPESGLTLSDSFGGISFTGRYVSYTKADTWYPIYASTGTMYSSWTDGSVNGEAGGNPNPRCAKFTGTDPMDLTFSVVGGKLVHNGANGPGGRNKFGRYPSAQLMYNDIWYYGTYLLEWTDRALFVPNSDWQVLQPFVGFRVSGDFGESWYDQTEPDNPLLENAHEKWIGAHGVAFNPYEVLIGAPHFVDFGYNLEHAPKDPATGRRWAYMVAHGADAATDIAHNSWVSGDNIYLLRILMPEGTDVEKNFAYMNNPANWQYYSNDGTYKTWNRDNLQEVYTNIRPIVDATGYLGNVGLTYNAPLKKFIMTLSRVDRADSFDTLVLEADAIDGDYKVVQYMKGFAVASYFMNIPSRFISDDGLTMWLCYSSNYQKIHSPSIGGSSYSMCLSEITLDPKQSARGNRYEAESMKRVGQARLVVDAKCSNGGQVNGLSRVGDGLEFWSKSKGRVLKMVVAGEGTTARRLSVYVNDQFAAKFIVTPTGEARHTEHQIPLNIGYGDKVTMRIDADDVSFNRIYGEMLAGEAFVREGKQRFFGNIDYVVVE